MKPEVVAHSALKQKSTTLFLSEFLIEGLITPYRLDHNLNGGGILFFVREDIPSNLIAIQSKPIGSFFVELNLRNDERFINFSNNTYKSLIGNHIDALSKYLISVLQIMRR